MIRLFVFAAALFSAAGPCRAFGAEDAVVTVQSPDKGVKFELSLRDGHLTFAVQRDGHAVIEPSPMRISVDGQELGEGVELGEVETYDIDEQYPWRGPHSMAKNHFRGAKVQVKHSASAYTLDIRAFNDGIAFRHIIPAADDSESRVPDESTTFHLPGDSQVWFHDLEGHYEAIYDSRQASEVEADQWIAPPMTYKLPGGAGYASITEADLHNYSGMALRADGKAGFKVVLGHAHHVSYPFRLRYEDDVERLTPPAAVAGEITSPWRVVLIAADLNALVNSDVVHNLCPPPDPDVFPQGMETEWLKPGRAVWKYLDGGDDSLEEMKNFSRWAGELGFEHHVIEGFWRRWDEDEIRELVDYSAEQGVSLWFWRHSRELRTPERREEFFSQLERLGVKGAKIDFFDHEHKEVVDHYRALLEDAARHKIMVNFHGANKPTGEARSWPNEMIREGVRGMEARSLRERAAHNTTLPFTRYLAGHGDYTPVVFGERRGDTTWAHQIATAAVFDEPLLTYGAHPQSLLENPAVEMIKSVPSVWDETIVLPPSEIGKLAVFARRHGDGWFLAVLNGPQEKSFRVPLSFLGGGEYQALLVADGDEGAESLKIDRAEHSAADELRLELRPGGGYIARFEPAQR